MLKVSFRRAIASRFSRALVCFSLLGLTTTTGAFAQNVKLKKKVVYVESSEGKSGTRVAQGIALDPSLGRNLQMATVSLEGAEAGDVLKISGNNIGSLTSEWDKDKHVLTLKGSASLAVYEKALRGLIYVTTDAARITHPRKVIITVGPGLAHQVDGRDHYYQFVTFKSGEARTWQNARKLAEGMTYLNKIPGYLATITSESEQHFVQDKLRERGWIGASDEGEKEVWRWKTGPEGKMEGGRGLRFTIVKGGGISKAGDNTLPYDDSYANWAPSEPNDYGGNEGFAHFYSGSDLGKNGKWNDEPADGRGAVRGYLVEFGDPSNKLDVSSEVTISFAHLKKTMKNVTVETWGIYGEGRPKTSDKYYYLQGGGKVANIRTENEGEIRIDVIKATEADGTYVWFKEAGTDNYLTKKSGRAVEWLPGKKPGSKWKEVEPYQKGTPAGWHSYTSAVEPSRYLRHSSFIMRADPDKGPGSLNPTAFPGDATWNIEPGKIVAPKDAENRAAYGVKRLQSAGVTSETGGPAHYLGGIGSNGDPGIVVGDFSSYTLEVRHTADGYAVLEDEATGKFITTDKIGFVRLTDEVEEGSYWKVRDPLSNKVSKSNGWFSLQSKYSEATGKPRYLRHFNYRTYVHGVDMLPKNSYEIRHFDADASWKFVDVDDVKKTLTLADARQQLIGNWSVDLADTEKRFGKSSMHDQLAGGFDMSFTANQFSASVGGHSMSYRYKLEGPTLEQHFKVEATDEDGDDHEEEMQFLDTNTIVFKFDDGNGKTPIVFTRK